MKWKITGLLWGVLFLSSGGAWADTHIPGGFVSGTWTVTGSPYVLDGNIVVHQDSTLTIEPGVDVLMAPSRRFRIEGQILALGTELDSIRFIATNTAAGSEGLDFLNTNFSPRDSSKLVYCEIKYGIASPYPDPYMHGGGLYIKNSSRLLVSHCLISHCRTRDVVGANGANGAGGSTQGQPGQPGQSITAGCGGGVYCDNSHIIMMDCELSFNEPGDGWGGTGGNGGGGGSMSAYSAQGGSGGAGGVGTGGHGGAICLYGSNPIISNNVIHHNQPGNGHGGLGGNGGWAFAEAMAYGGGGGLGGIGYGGQGGAIYDSDTQAFFQNNLIYLNAAGEGYGGTGGNGGSASTQLPYGIRSPGSGGIGGDAWGGNGFAYSCAGGSGDILSLCTIVEQSILSSGHGGTGGVNGWGTVVAPPGQGGFGSSVIYGNTMNLLNCIVWMNASPTIDPQATVTYSCIQNGHAGIGNITTDPLFAGPYMQNFCLSQIGSGQTQQSPCVDAGNPGSAMIVGTTRTDGVQDSGIVDMGYHYPLGTPQPWVALTLTPHDPPIQIPPGGGGFRFDLEITYNDQFPYVIDLWTSITLPDGNPMPIFTRNNITLPPGGVLSRPNLIQYIPGSAMSGNYVYHGYIREHYTWEPLAADSFAFVKLPGSDSPTHDLGWALFGWDDVSAANAIPKEFALHGNFPNPFNPATTIRFDLPADASVLLEVFDINGRSVGTIHESSLPAGRHGISFDGSNLSSGIYLYRLAAGPFEATGKMVLLK
ncbi:MAG TPA: T9SS type A sorting domain-containing protein [bacterium]|jgi:hypothetical protein